MAVGAQVFLCPYNAIFPPHLDRLHHRSRIFPSVIYLFATKTLLNLQINIIAVPAQVNTTLAGRNPETALENCELTQSNFIVFWVASISGGKNPILDRYFRQSPF